MSGFKSLWVRVLWPRLSLGPGILTAEILLPIILTLDILTAEILLPVIPTLALPLPFEDLLLRALTGPLLTTIILKIVKWVSFPIKIIFQAKKNITCYCYSGYYFFWPCGVASLADASA